MTSTAAQLLADFTAKIASLDSATLREAYRQLFSENAPFQLIDKVLDRLMELDGTEATEQFIDSVG